MSAWLLVWSAVAAVAVAAEVPCSSDAQCVYACDRRAGRCASPLGLDVCFYRQQQGTNNKCRDAPRLSAQNKFFVPDAWRQRALEGPVIADGMPWYRFKGQIVQHSGGAPLFSLFLSLSLSLFLSFVSFLFLLLCSALCFALIRLRSRLATTEKTRGD